MWQTFLFVDVFIDVPNFGSVLKYEYKFAFSYHQKQKVQNWIFHSVAKITKMSHSNFHAENDNNFWCESQVQKMLASLAMMQNETFLSDFDTLWLRFVTMAKLGHFEANIPISFVLVVHLLPRFPLPRYKSWLEWRIKKREQSKHCIHSSIRSKINFQLSVPTAKYKTNQIAQRWKIKEKVDFLSKRAKRALNVMEGCDKKTCT